MFYSIAAVALILFGCSSANASDLAKRLDWSGLYVGAHFGVASLDTKFRTDFGQLSSDTYNVSPKVGGAYFGYGREFGVFYAGVEGSWGWYGNATIRDLSASVSPSGVGSAGAVGGGAAVGGAVGGAVDGGVIPGSVIGGHGGTGALRSETTSVEGFETKLQSVGSLKARLGYPVGRMLPFVSAGLAAGHVEIRYVAGTAKRIMRGPTVISETSQGHLVDDRKFMFGYAFGTGLELAISSRVSVRGEYVFTDLGNRIYEYSDGAGSASFKSRLHEARLGVAFRF